MAIKIATNFSRYTDNSLAEKAQHIVNSLTGNTAYPTPEPTLATVQTAIDSFTTALANQANMGKQGTLVKNQQRDALEQLLNQLGLYVQTQGGNDAVTLQSSGYDLQKGKGAPIGILPKPSDLKIVPGPNPGTMKVSFAAIDGANTYLFQYTDIPANGGTVWQSLYSGKSTYLIDGLISGKQYTFRVCGIGTDPTLVYSDAITSFVL